MIEFYETTYDLETKRRADMEAILFGKEDCRPAHSYGPTMRPYHLLHLVTGGEGTLRIGGESFAIGAGDAFLIPAEQMSFYQASDTNPWSYSWAGFTGVRATRYAQQLLELAPERYVLRGLNMADYAPPVNAAAVLKETSASNYFFSKQVLYTLFSFFARDFAGLLAAREAPDIAARLKFYLDTKYMEKLRIDELARLFGVHPTHLARVFRAAYGLAPKQYLQQLKLEKASELLRRSDMLVALIAESLGFEDQHAFSRCFKQQLSVSPTEFRKRAEHAAGR